VAAGGLTRQALARGSAVEHQLAMLHAETAEFVELTPGTRDADGKLALERPARLDVDRVQQRVAADVRRAQPV